MGYVNAPKTTGPKCPQVWKIGLPGCGKPSWLWADLAGGHWSETVDVAAVTDVTESKRRTPSLGVLLLRDIRAIFDDLGKDRLSTVQVLTDLREMEDSPIGPPSNGENRSPTGPAQRLKVRPINLRLSAWLSWC